jgi:hypothetical protein
MKICGASRSNAIFGGVQSPVHANELDRKQTMFNVKNRRPVSHETGRFCFCGWNNTEREHREIPGKDEYADNVPNYAHI